MPKLMIAALREGQEIASQFMIKSRHLRPFQRKPGVFLVLGLCDRTGEIEAKLWENGEDWYWKIKDQDVVEISGKTQFFNGNLELAIERLRVLKDDEYQLEDFLPATERDVDEMVAILRRTIDRVEDPCLNALLNRVFDSEALRDFSRAPAAKMIHHAYLGGLLEHTLEVIRLCDTCLDLYPILNRDLLLTGAMLHDVGKMREYVYRRRIDFSDEGRLLGHIALGEQMIVEKASSIEGFPDDLLVQLRHMVLSHHGQYEWQSPKRPKTIEACVLHLADYFSGQVAIFSASIKANAEADSSWTSYNKFLDRPIFIRNNISRMMADEAGESPRRLMEERDCSY